MLLAASASHRVRQIVTTAPYTRDVVTRFVAGDTADDALRVTRRLLADGLLVTLDYLGEDTASREQAAAVADEYIRLLARLGSAGLARGGRAEVSVKPTAVGLGLAEHGEKTAAENIARRCASWPSFGRTSPTSAAYCRATCGAPRTTARTWRWPARGSGCARAPTAPRTRWRSSRGPTWTARMPAACGSCWPVRA